MKPKRITRWSKATFALVAAALLTASGILAGCDAQPASLTTAGNLMEQVTAQETAADPLSKETQTVFTNATAGFSLDLFRKCWKAQENSLVSPISAVLALGMVSNGAAANTQEQFLKTLANSQMTQEQLNEAYRQWAARLTDFSSLDHLETENRYEPVLKLANSIWFDQKSAVLPQFLQTNADFFDAGAYQLDFCQSEQAAQIMNEWVSQQTNGKIQNAVDELSPDALMVLINTTLFEMPWRVPVDLANISQRTFTTADGSKVNADFLHVWESYLESDLAYGMKKPYAYGSHCSFVALLPKEGHTLADLVQNMTAEQWLTLVGNPVDRVRLDAYLPKFRYEVSNQLKQPLQGMGLTDAFQANTADFSSASQEPVFLSDVIQKTFIDLNEHGTSAAAATVITAATTGAPVEEERKTIVFDQPFLYAIIDDESGLPLFLGTVANPAG